jgi:hypothetical protein
LNLEQVQVDIAADFYLTQYRIWEFMCGSLIALSTKLISEFNASTLMVLRFNKLLPNSFFIIKPEIITSTFINFSSLIALLILIYGFVEIDKNILYPGKWALIPVFSTSVLILNSQKTWINGKILANKILVWFGLISYPIYLWHWPILSFARILECDTPNVFVKIIILFISILLAWFTYNFIERPLRFRNKLKATVLILVLQLITIGFVGFYVYVNNGIKGRLIGNVEANTLDNYNYFTQFDIDSVRQNTWEVEDKFFNLESKKCFYHTPDINSLIVNQCGTFKDTKKNKILLIGDSHAAYLGYGLKDFIKNNYEFEQIQVASAGCGVLSIDYETDKKCNEFDLFIKEKINHFKMILYNNRKKIYFKKFIKF